jgi:hypothetical protein
MTGLTWLALGCSSGSPISTIAPMVLETGPPATLSTGGPTPAMPPFLLARTIDVIPGPANPMAADFNEDGLLDLVVPSSESDEIALLLGNGDGTFNPPSRETAVAADVVDPADVNGDGHVDVVIAGYTEAVVLMGSGHGTFEVPRRYPIQGNLDEGNAFWVDTGDLNTDDAVDILVSFYGAAAPTAAAPGHLAVLLNTGTGEFDDPAFYDCPACTAVVTADFDEDGQLDAATANFDANVRFWRGNGDGTLADPAKFPISANGAAIISDDLNGDGHQDLLTGNDASNNISVLLGNGDGSFADADGINAGNTHSIAIVDLDRDGHLDLLAAGYTDGFVRFYRGDGGGGFTSTAGIDLGGAHARGVVTGDFDEDGRLDLAVTDDTAGTATILLAN